MSFNIGFMGAALLFKLIFLFKKIIDQHKGLEFKKKFNNE